MIEVLKAAKRPVPKYLKTLAIENNKKNHAESAFAMYCFWTGEVELGKIEGVVSTEAGWLEGGEVTRVVYDKERVSLQDLTRMAAVAGCARKVYAAENEVGAIKNVSTGKLDKSYRKARSSDQKKQLSNWKALRKLPGLTEMQLTKVNAFAPSNMNEAMEWLSPRQRSVLGKSK